MNRPKVKFCGITREQDALFAEQLRVDFLGLIFAESERRVSIERAKKIVDCLGPRIEPIGVFVDEDIRTLIEISDAVGLAGVQLHGEESSDYVTQVKKHRPHLKFIKAFEVDEHFDFAKIDSFECDYLLFDSPRKSSTRSALNIGLLKPFCFRKPFFVAGGMNPKNVAELNGILRPFAIDVSSGIEQSPGVKCLDKMSQFMSTLSEEPI
jgi:phosphoribosylanthranilate isomerase